jgi:CDGSH-type Zn-finger protein
LSSTKITVRPNGPLRLEGEFEICDMDGKAFSHPGRTSIALCRCGQSEKKPFCDGTHKKISFASDVKAFELPPPEPKPPAT